MTRKFLITGTDTGVGKTVFSALLCRYAKENNLSLTALKPLESGVEPQLEAPSDALLLAMALGCKHKVAEIMLHRYRLPLAPSVAANFEQKPIDYKRLLVAIQDRCLANDYLLIEGAGGLLVPITSNKTFADLAQDCALEVILVVGSKLGAINHASLTFLALQSMNIPLLGYVVNSVYPEDDVSDISILSNRETLKAVAKRYEATELGAVRFLPQFSALAHSEQFSEHFDSAYQQACSDGLSQIAERIFGLNEMR